MKNMKLVIIERFTEFVYEISKTQELFKYFSNRTEKYIEFE